MSFSQTIANSLKSKIRDLSPSRKLASNVSPVSKTAERKTSKAKSKQPVSYFIINQFCQLKQCNNRLRLNMIQRIKQRVLLVGITSSQDLHNFSCHILKLNSNNCAQN